MPPLNFPERGPRQPPWAHRKARFGAGTYCSKRRRTGAARPLGGTRTSRTPRNLRWKGNQRSTIHRSQRRWRPKVTSTFSPRQVGVPEGPLTSVRGETPSPVGGAPLGSRSAARGGRGAQTGMEDGRDVGSTSWPLTKMSIRHLSYISTDLFWTKISTANTKAAVLPLGAPVLLWDLSIYIQTHKFFSIQKICGCVTKKFLLPFSQVPPSHQLSGTIRQLAPCWSTTLPAAQSFYPSRVPAYPPTGQKATNWLLLGDPDARRRPLPSSVRGAAMGALPPAPGAQNRRPDATVLQITWFSDM